MKFVTVSRNIYILINFIYMYICIYIKCEVTLVMATALCSFAIYRMFSDNLENTTKTLFCLSQHFMPIIFANGIYGSESNIKHIKY